MTLSRRALLAGAALACFAQAGCAASEQWREVPLDAEPQALTSLNGGLLVGTAGVGLQAPDGPIGVRPVTGYGREAGWLSLAASGDRLAAVGVTRGGAHGNARWSVFGGDRSGGVEEWEQPFDVFHGWGAGQLIGVAFAGDQPTIVGSWQSEAAGNDPSIWLLDGQRWRRRSSTGTALASTRVAMGQAHAVAGGDRLMVVGQLIDLQPLRTRAVAWTAADPAADWSRIDLPAAGSNVTAQSVAAFEGGWLVGGVDDDRVIAWTIGPDLAVSTVDLPGSLASRPADGRPVEQVRVAASAGGLLLGAGDGETVRTGSGRAGSWRESTAPGTDPVTAAWAGTPALITAGSGQRLFQLS